MIAMCKVDAITKCVKFGEILAILKGLVMKKKCKTPFFKLNLF